MSPADEPTNATATEVDAHDAPEAPLADGSRDDAPGGESPAESTEEPNILDTAPWWTTPAILLGVPALLAVLTQIRPSLFYDRFVWQYYWGPIKADAARRALEHNGVIAEPGYNIVNTLSWVVLLAVCLFGLAQMLRRQRVAMDNTLIVAATTWVVAGAIFHVMQDTHLFAKPLEYFFITPPIYLLFAAGGVVSIMLGVHLAGVARERDLDAAVARLWWVMAAFVGLYTLLAIVEWRLVIRFLHPGVVALFAAATFFALRVRIRQQGTVVPADVTLFMAFTPLAMSLAYVARFIRAPWSPVGDNAYPESALIAPALAGATAGIIWLAARARLAKGGGEFAKALASPINVLLVFSQMVDAFATSIGIDLAGYSEKHVLSARVIEVTRDVSHDAGWAFGATYPTFIGFAPLKLLVALGVIIAIDVYSKEDVEKRPELIGLLRFAVIMVGIGPGVRDFVRMALGV